MVIKDRLTVKLLYGNRNISSIEPVIVLSKIL